MNVTKQQQIEWLAKNFDTWPSEGKVITMSTNLLGTLKGPTTFSPVHYISAKEWEQVRDKMQKQQDNSWHERGEFPPIVTPVELWIGGSFAYNCEFKYELEDSYIVWNLDTDKPDCIASLNSEFRPVRTNREKAIDELNALVGDIEKYPTWRDAIAAIVDAGYHK